MRILITGTNGLLGGFLVPELLLHGHAVYASGLGSCRLPLMYEGKRAVYEPMDITDALNVESVVSHIQPDCIIHAAAMTQADDCEKDPVTCWTINVTATRFLIAAAKRCGARFLYVSTDFVFDGLHGPYAEEAPTGPVNYYGCSKLAAEKAVQESGLDWSIARTVLVYGHSDNMARSSLMSWVSAKLSAGESIRVVDDQVRTPTYAGDLATGIRLMIEKKATGIYHLSGKDVLTPYDMAVMTAQYAALPVDRIERVNAAVFSQPARRPLRTGFIIEKARLELGYDPVSFTEGLRITMKKPSGAV